MSLISCKECGSKASTKAAACPTCGAPIRRPSQIGKAFVRLLSRMGGLIGGLLGLMFALSYLTSREAGPPHLAVAPEVELEAGCRKMAESFAPEERAAFLSNCVKAGGVALKSHEISPAASVTNNLGAPNALDRGDILGSIELTPRSIPYELNDPAAVKDVVLHGQLDQGTLWNTTAYFLTPRRGPKIYIGELGWSQILDSWVTERAFVQVSGRVNVHCNDSDKVSKAKLEVCEWFDSQQPIKVARIPKITENTRDRVISVRNIGRPVRVAREVPRPAALVSADSFPHLAQHCEQSQPAYIERISMRIRSNTIFDRVDAAGENPTVKIHIPLFPDGSLKGSPRLAKSSRVPTFDQAVIDAILRSAPFPNSTEGCIAPNELTLVHSLR